MVHEFMTDIGQLNTNHNPICINSSLFGSGNDLIVAGGAIRLSEFLEIPKRFALLRNETNDKQCQGHDGIDASTKLVNKIIRMNET